MSWFDSSFTFARTALSQAQKSIDTVLDIGEEERGALDPAEPGPLSTSNAVTKSSDDKPNTSPKFSTSTPKLSDSRSVPSTRPPTSLKNTPVAASPSQDGFSSTWGGTWGGGDTPWSSLTSTPAAAAAAAAAALEKKTESEDQKEKLPQSPSAGGGERASAVSSSSSSGKKGRGSRKKRREGSGSRPEASLSLPPSGSPVEQTKDPGGGISENGSLALSSGAQQQQPSSVARDIPSPHSTADKIKALESSVVGSIAEVTANVLETVEPSRKTGTEVSVKTGAEVKETKSNASVSYGSTTLTGSTWNNHLSCNSESVSQPISAGGGETDRGGEGGGEGEVYLVVPSTTEEATDGAVNHEAQIHTINREENDKKEPSTSFPPLNPPETRLPQVSTSVEEEIWSEVPLEPVPATEVTSSDSTNPMESTDRPPSASEGGRTSSPHIVTPSQPSPNSPLPISLSSPLPTSPSPPSPHITSSPLPSTPPVPSPTNTPEAKPAEETVSFPLQQLPTDGVQGEEVQTFAEGTGKISSTPQDSTEPSNDDDDKLVEGGSGPLKEKESRESEVSSGGTEGLKQELERVKKLLEARETKMVEMSREVIQLSETNQELQSRLSAAEQDLNTSQGGVEELRSEFTKRIGTTEKKLQTIIKERDSLKKQLHVFSTDQSQQRKSASQELSALLKEKEEQIAGLMDEGEKLSKKELQNSNIIKKLKEKNKQNDQLLTAQRQQIEDCEREVGRLKELVKKKEDNEKKYQESLSQLNSIAEQQEKELTALKAERDELTDKARSLQTNLDNAYKELSDLHKVTAVNQSVAHEAVLSAEQSARQELTEAVEKQRVEHHREKEQLLLEISELRASVSRCEQQSAWREERMKQEVSDVQQRLQEAEMRNQELTTTISQTTKPFLRQIETLRSAHSAQTANWEKVEVDLTHRLVEAQAQLTAAVEKERSSTEKALTLQSRVTHLEKQSASLRQEKSRLAASLELEKAKAETFEESQQRESAKMEATRSSMQQSLEELRKEKEMLERQLEYERVRLEAESRKACLESQEKERLRSQLASSLSRGLSRQSSTASTTHTQSEILEKSLVQQLSEDARGGSVSDSGTSYYHGKIPPTSASAIEQLQSLIKQKEGELANAQTLVSSLERSRAAMANDLAAVSSQNVDLSEKVEAIPHLKTNLQELQKRNEALLQMYGEKAEEAEELRLDIQDLKEMYRQQIDALTKR